MRIGVFLIGAGFPGREPGEVLRDTVEAVAAAEKAGFDDAWIAEHHFMSYGVCPSAVTLAGVALGRTTRIQIGTAVSVLSTQHPVALAEQAAILDQVSGGRFVLGVGRGGPWVDLEVFGTGLPRFEHGFRESLDLLCEALKRDTISAEGEFFTFRKVPMVPAVRLRPVVACTSPETVVLAAQRGLPMLLGMHIGDEQKVAMLRDYGDEQKAAMLRDYGDEQKAATLRDYGERAVWPGPGAEQGDGWSSGGQEPGDRGGRSPGGRNDRDDRNHREVAGSGGSSLSGHVAAAMGYVADSTEQAVRELRETLPQWLRPGLAGYVPIDGRARPERDISEYVDFLCETHPVGSPDHCVEKIKRTAEVTGLRHMILMVEGAGDHARTLENIRRLGADVLPRVRGRVL